jgi:DNA-binding beta-propeller fold protein YncE
MKPGKRRAAALCLAISALLLAVPAACTAATNHPFLGAITGEKIGPFEQFKGACGVAVDSAGDIYVADYYQNRIVVFNAKEEFLTTIANVNPLDPAGVAPIDGPCDLAVDSSGDVYVNNYHRDVVRITPANYPPANGTSYGAPFLIDSGQPTGVAVDPLSDDVYVDDRTFIAVYDSSGAAVISGGEPLRIGLGSLGDGYGVDVSGFPGTAGRVYAADGNAVKVYDPALDPAAPVEVIDGSATPRAGFRFLTDTDLAIDQADGHLYIAENLQPHFERPEAVVYEFSAQGHYRGQIPNSKAEGESSFLRAGEPSGVAVRPGGTIYVSSGNYENAAVFVFGPAASTPTRLLSAAKTGAGGGTLASSPPGLRCGTACEGEFEQGSGVTLFATPDRGSRLAGWTGCDAELTANSCQVTMAADRSVSAEFEPAPQRTLTVVEGGTGAGQVVSSPAGIDCPGACEDEFDELSSVILTAQAGAASRLAGWSGCDSQPGPSSCRVTMGAARSVSADFEALPAEEEEGPAPRQPRTPFPALPAEAPPLALAPLRIGKFTARGSSGKLQIAAPAPGEISTFAPSLRSSGVLAFRAGQMTLSLRLTGAAARTLGRAKGGKLAVRVRVAFTPFDEGSVLHANKAVIFKREKGGR